MIAATVFVFTEVSGVHYTYMRKIGFKCRKTLMFWRRLGGIMSMLAFGLSGEVGEIRALIGLAIGMSGWAFTLFKLSEAGNTSSECSDAVGKSFNNTRITVSAGWAIYHLGYLSGTLTSAADPKLLNVIYNVADIVNKIGSCYRTGLAPRP